MLEKLKNEVYEANMEPKAWVGDIYLGQCQRN